jgi:hypothetical protein
MATDVNNEELNKYNDSLRDSINYSKQLSDNILALSKRMANLTLEERRSRSALSDINKSIKDTLKLSDKLIQGKLKQKEIDTQIKKLQDDYTTYINETVNGLNNINELYQKQITLDNQLSLQAQKRLTLNQDIASLLSQHNTLSQQLNAISSNPAQANQAALLRDQLKDVNNELNIKEKQLNVSDKLTKELNEQIDKVDRALEGHERLLEIYTLELKKAEAIKEELNKQNGIFGKLGENARNFASSFDDVKKLLNPFSAIFDFIKKIAFAASDQVTRIQKGLVVSREEAYNLRQEFNNAAVTSGNIAVNTERMVAANVELGKQLGFNSRFSNDMNIEFIKLTKQIGLSDEAAGGLAKLTKATGMDFKTTKNVVLETTQRLSSQYGIQLDQKDVLEEIGKISGQTLAMLKGNPKALAEAVAQARLLGTNLDTVKKQASALLDFETSIENELQAELITGRQFNLERARSASLTGDLTTAMKELNNQGIDFNDFSNMNVIAQEKVASALGLQTDELSDQLLKQQYMGMSREQIVAMSGEEVANRIEALSAQDKFNLAMEKMQDIVGRIVGGPLGQFADMVAKLLENSTVLYGVMTTIAAISFTKLVAGLAASAVQAGLLAAGSATAMSALTLGVGAIAIAAAITGIAAAYTAFKDDAAEPIGDMFSSKGKTLISTKEGGLFEPSPNDDIAVAPGIGDMINRPKQQTTVVQDNSTIVNAINTLISETKNTNSSLDRLNTKQAIIKIDSQNMGTAQVIGNYNLA